MSHQRGGEEIKRYKNYLKMYNTHKNAQVGGALCFQLGRSWKISPSMPGYEFFQSEKRKSIIYLMKDY